MFLWEEEQDFERFLMIMDDQLEALAKDADRFNVSISMSPGHLDQLEKLFDRMAASATGDTLSGLIVYFARWLGEFVRLNYGGKWRLYLDDRRSPNFNLPVITGHSPVPGLDFSPVNVMRAFALKRKPGMLARAVSAQVRPEAVDLSDLVAAERRNDGPKGVG